MTGRVDTAGRALVRIGEIQALGSSGRFALLGVGLLREGTLTIDYPSGNVTIK